MDLKDSHIFRLIRAMLLVLFVSSFFLPAFGDTAKSGGVLPGFGAMVGAVLLLVDSGIGFGSLAPERCLLLPASSVLANAFFVWAWICLPKDFTELQRHESSLAPWLGTAFFLLTLSPIGCLGSSGLLIGYYMWISAIGGLVLCLWAPYFYRARTGQGQL